MGLDYTEGCVNFREVGGYLNLILGENRFPEWWLLREGTLDYVKEASEIGRAQSLINLRNRPDLEDWKAT